MVLRSERLAARIGIVIGRVVAWARGVLRRSPSNEDFAAATLHLRTGLIEGWHACGIRVTIACLVNYLAQGALLMISVRAVGFGHDIRCHAFVGSRPTGVHLRGRRGTPDRRGPGPVRAGR